MYTWFYKTDEVKYSFTLPITIKIVDRCEITIPSVDDFRLKFYFNIGTRTVFVTAYRQASVI